MNINRNRHSYLNRISILPEVYETQQHIIIDTSDGERTHYTKRFNSMRTNGRRNCLTGKTVLQIAVEQRDRLNREERDLARDDIEILKDRATRSAKLEIQRENSSKENTNLEYYANASVNKDFDKQACDELFAKFDDFFQKLAELQNEMGVQPLSDHLDQNQTRQPRKRVSWRLDLNECVLIDQI
ncbi:predicted protein [Chaetoceros tenuissimus]|uniref:Uncharacterized protein n=1 Tax=Chaetoceros tenuissimus TaxID=426638 RepID=A0AAD3CQQ4_9STRA|nr:predicted protein [Chaetoceros tenuissimus]